MENIMDKAACWVDYHDSGNVTIIDAHEGVINITKEDAIAAARAILAYFEGEN